MEWARLDSQKEEEQSLTDNFDDLGDLDDETEVWSFDLPESDDYVPPDDEGDSYRLETEYSLGAIRSLSFEDRPLPCLTRDDVFSIGASHLLSAAPKTGKSTIVSYLCRDWADEHGILYFSEEFERVWHKRAIEFELEAEDDKFTIIPALGISTQRLLQRARNGPEDIVIVDTTRALLGIKSLGNSDEVVHKLRPWLQLCQSGKTLILLHHMLIKANTRRFGVAVAGGHGLLGAVDTVIQYTELDDSLRLCEVRSRLQSEHVVFVVRKTGPLFTVEDAPHELTLTESEQEVWACLDVQQARTLPELMEATGFAEAKTRRIVLDLARKGLARDISDNPGHGGRGMRSQWVAVQGDDEEEEEG